MAFAGSGEYKEICRKGQFLYGLQAARASTRLGAVAVHAARRRNARRKNVSLENGGTRALRGEILRRCRVRLYPTKVNNEAAVPQRMAATRRRPAEADCFRGGHTDTRRHNRSVLLDFGPRLRCPYTGPVTGAV